MNKPQYDENRLRDMHVLLVDDNAINTTIMKKMLQYKGCFVDVAADGQIGVTMFCNSKQDYYDVILTDVQMPNMNGFEEARAIRALDRPDAKRIPIIAETADGYDEIVQKIKNAGMNERLIKPINAELLCSTIVRLVEETADR